MSGQDQQMIMMTRTLSEEVYQRSCQVMPGGVNSPVRAFHKVGGTPLIIKSGRGDLITDVDGNSYIDFCGSWGAAILGHAHPEVVRTATEQMARGSSFGTATELEEQVASKVISLVPSVEKIRFVSTGTEATMTAIRLARGFTGRSKIVKFAGCYHGHSDMLLVQAGSGAQEASSKGIPAGAIADTLVLPFNDADQFSDLISRCGHEIAAVILEPIPANMGVVLPDPRFLQILREETERVGALLIFDEVISGFRVSLGGAQELYGIRPDLSCFGKIIGGGFPAAAFGGRAEIMNHMAPLGQVYQAGTLSGNSVAMSAALATLELIEEPSFYQKLQEKADRLANPLKEYIFSKQEPLCLTQVGSLLTLFLGAKEIRNQKDVLNLDSKAYAKLFHYLLERGIYLPPLQQEAWFVSAAHTDEHLDYAAKCLIDYLLTSRSG